MTNRLLIALLFISLPALGPGQKKKAKNAKVSEFRP